VDARAAAYARLFETVHEGVYIGTVGPGGTSTLAANAHLKLILGYDSETPDPDVRPFAPEQCPDAASRLAFLDRLSADGAVVNYLIRLSRADRSAVWVEITGRAEREGDALRIEALFRDVSERKKLDDETRDIYHQLLQAEKMAALGQTISGVAHELNNPLATILTWAERLSQRTPHDPTIRRGLEVILGEAERSARIVRNLLTFARKRQTTRGMIDINQVVRETLALRAYEQRVTNIMVIDALAAGLPPVFADAHQIKQVLLNLVINAEQAMLSAHGRGVLVVRTWHDADRDCVILEINDDGPGIPEDVHAKIFDPFFTTKEVGKGTGLGLTVAYAIINEHGGRIRLESPPHSGASFFVELPVTEGHVSTLTPQGPTVSTPQQDPPAHASILVVDDEAALATAVCAALQDAGYTVEQASDGEQALARIGARGFDLVVCDLKMPRMDGPAFYRELRSRDATMARRVMFVTGDVIGTDAETFLRESGCRWLAKPFRLSDLVRTAREALANP